MGFAVLTPWGCAEGGRQVIIVTGVFSPEWKVRGSWVSLPGPQVSAGESWQ